MKHRCTMRWIAVTAAGLAAFTAFAASGPAGDVQRAIPLPAADIDHFLESAVLELGGGCALLLIHEGKVVYRKAAGSFDLQKPIPIASATKWLSGAVLLALVDEKKLDLNDPVFRYIPAFGGDKAGITVRQLCCHTSGLPMAHPALEKRDIGLAEAVVAIAAAPLMSPPGKICMYGDVSVQVAGRVAEIAGGRDWKSLFSAKLLEPLAMHGTSCSGDAATANPHLAGGAWSTAGDYANFLVMLLNGGQFGPRRVLSAEAVAEMFRDQTGGSTLRFNPFEYFAELHPGWRQVRYGICNWLEAFDPADGRVLEASAPGIFGFCPWIDFKRNLAGIFVCQSGMQKAFPVYLKLKTILRAFWPPPRQ